MAPTPSPPFTTARANNGNVHVRLKSSVLCTHLERDCLIAGGFGGYTYLVDPRTPGGVLSCHKYHKRAVLSIAVDDRQVVSVGDDSRLVVFDRRLVKAHHKKVSLHCHFKCTAFSEYLTYSMESWEIPAST